jgi:hypothetical protein
LDIFFKEEIQKVTVDFIKALEKYGKRLCRIRRNRSFRFLHCVLLMLILIIFLA